MRLLFVKKKLPERLINCEVNSSLYMMYGAHVKKRTPSVTQYLEGVSLHNSFSCFFFWIFTLRFMLTIVCLFVNIKLCPRVLITRNLVHCKAVYPIKMIMTIKDVGSKHFRRNWSFRQNCRKNNAPFTNITHLRKMLLYRGNKMLLSYISRLPLYNNDAETRHSPLSSFYEDFQRYFVFLYIFFSSSSSSSVVSIFWKCVWTK